MTPVANFQFVIQPGLGPHELMASQEVAPYMLTLRRRMRLEPLPAMKQPLLNAAIMGLETVITVTAAGQALGGYRWQLRRQGRVKMLERGVLDSSGAASSLALPLVAGPFELRLLAPLARRGVSVTRPGVTITS